MPKHTLIGYSIQVNPNGYLNSGADLNELGNTPEPPNQRDLSLLSVKEKGELKISSVENHVSMIITYSIFARESDSSFLCDNLFTYYR